MSIIERAAAAYTKHFGAAPTSAAIAPGRVEIMGNHTDYNGGYVLPAAIDRATVITGVPVDSDTITLYAADFDREATFSLQDIKPDPRNTWASYVLGVVKTLQLQGIHTGGFQAALTSDVPVGAGLSSSAAIEVATALFLKLMFPYDMAPMEIVRTCQRAENEFVGANTGIQDQFASLYGRDDSFLFLDCLTLENDAVKMGRSDIALVVCDSGVKHSHASGDYNTRRAECMAAAAHFGKPLLRDVTWSEFVSRETELPLNERKRVRHILAENSRVLAMREAVVAGDTVQMGRLFAEGHASCRDLFENSVPEIDFLVDTAVSLPGCIGAKLAGGGWGGCTINLVENAEVESFCQELAAHYKTALNRDAAIYPCRAAEGAHTLEL